MDFFPRKHSNEYFPISEHLFEYIGTQFPPPSAIQYGKMSSITMFVSNEYNRHDTTIYALVIDRHFIFYFISYCIDSSIDFFVRPYEMSA
jgi:hypothetical protein